MQEELKPGDYVEVKLPYSSSHKGTLSINKGDLLIVFSLIDKNWLKVVTLDKREGMVPRSHITQKASNREKADESKKEKQLLALFDYQPAAERLDLLGFKQGTILCLVGDADHEGWYQAEVDGLSGLVPKKYFAEVVPLEWEEEIEIEEEAPKSLNDVLISKINPARTARSASSPSIVACAKFEPGKFPRRCATCGKRETAHNLLVEDVRRSSLSSVKTPSIASTASSESLSTKVEGATASNQVNSLKLDKLEDSEEEPKEEDGPKILLFVEALYDFKGGRADLLAFKKGELLEVTERVSEQWFRARNGDESGLIPTNYVKKHSRPKHVELTPRDILPTIAEPRVHSARRQRPVLVASSVSPRIVEETNSAELLV